MTLAELELPGGPFTIRKAEASDVASIIGLLAADQLRASVESIAIEDRHPYDLAFQAIDADPAQLLVAVVSTVNEVVATMQLTFIPGLARAGAMRMQIEAVRVRSNLRSNDRLAILYGTGETREEAVERCRARARELSFRLRPVSPSARAD